MQRGAEKRESDGQDPCRQLSSERPTFAGDSSRPERKRMLTEAGKVYSGSGVAQQSMFSAEEVFLAQGLEGAQECTGAVIVLRPVLTRS